MPFGPLFLVALRRFRYNRMLVKTFMRFAKLPALAG